ncbi:hypothetical protein SAMN05421819_0398 [Bryocella elongata]|uniref:Uncharacterized protein n=1 Tax=Bryocella elongata TaxID=863522 RepID=A0A1H5SXX0_9BACT|nr:hypothetical protein [Bryocella elongata]SEF55390.1 hypothetical protein SAMN05421819_0398 [Bryocella elongata]
MVSTSRVTFSEANSAAPTYFVTAFSVGLLVIDRAAHLLLHFQTRAIYIAASWVLYLGALLGINVLAGCIWHPIPKERRAVGGMSLLNLNSPTRPPYKAPGTSAILQQLNEPTSDFEEVDASQTEMRDAIEWRKLVVTSATLASAFFLLVHWAH